MLERRAISCFLAQDKQPKRKPPHNTIYLTLQKDCQTCVNLNTSQEKL
jgi:hypothetical protein